MGVVEQHHGNARLSRGRSQDLAGGIEQLGEHDRVDHVLAQVGRRRAGIRWATAPNGIATVERSADTRSTRRPTAAATSRHSSPRRVLPTPGGP